MTDKRAGAPRQPSAEERRLFQTAMRDARGTGDKPGPDSAAAEADHPTPTPRRQQAAAAKPTRPRPAPARPIPVSSMTAGLDKRTAQRLRRGKIASEASLDLHGHTAAEARRALDRFLEDAAGRSLRCVLIVTGTAAGRGREHGIMPDRSAGVLRASLPAWLGEPDNRVRVIAHCPAQPRDGGAGASYVLLRRRRR